MCLASWGRGTKLWSHQWELCLRLSSGDLRHQGRDEPMSCYKPPPHVVSVDRAGDSLASEVSPSSCLLVICVVVAPRSLIPGPGTPHARYRTNRGQKDGPFPKSLSLTNDSSLGLQHFTKKVSVISPTLTTTGESRQSRAQREPGANPGQCDGHGR